MPFFITEYTLLCFMPLTLNHSMFIHDANKPGYVSFCPQVPLWQPLHFLPLSITGFKLVSYDLCFNRYSETLSFHRNHNSITHRAKVAYSCHASSILFYVYCLFPLFPFLLHSLIKLLFISCFPHIFGYSNYNFHFIALPGNIFLLLFEKEVFPCDSNWFPTDMVCDPSH